MVTKQGKGHKQKKTKMPILKTVTNLSHYRHRAKNIDEKRVFLM